MSAEGISLEGNGYGILVIEYINDYFGKVHNWDYNSLSVLEQNLMCFDTFNILKEKYSIL